MGDFDRMTAEQYERLYARFVERPASDLFRFVRGGMTDKRVLDVCAGNLRLSRAAYEHGADTVKAIEKSFQMARRPWNMPPSFSRYCTDLVDDLPDDMPPVKDRFFDVAFCQQAVNYWWGIAPVEWIASKIKDDGVFIFNTFLNPPKRWPEMSTRYYRMNGHAYRESSWLQDKDKVVHLQQCDNDIHMSTFRHIHLDEFDEVMSRTFKNVSIHTSGNSTTIIGYNPKR